MPSGAFSFRILGNTVEFFDRNGRQMANPVASVVAADSSAGMTAEQFDRFRRGVSTHVTTPTTPEVSKPRPVADAGMDASTFERFRRGIKISNSQPTSPEQEKPVTVPPPSTPSSEPLVCTDPKKALCEGVTPPPVRVQAERHKIVEQAMAESQMSKERLIQGSIPDFKQYISTLRFNVERSNPVAIASQVVDDLKNNVSRFARVEDQGRMRAALDNHVVMSFAELISLIPTPEFVDRFMLTCGPDGMSLNGGNYGAPLPLEDPRFKGRKIIALCPAYFSDGITPEDMYDLLSHEFGHAIDALRFPARFNRLAACFSQNYPGFSDQILNETTADFWRWKNVAKRMKDQGSPQAALAMARKISWDRCTNIERPRSELRYPARVQSTFERETANPKHPGPDFRLFGFARDPDVRKALGCSVPKAGETPLCDI